MENIKTWHNTKIKGYKVFNCDWTCKINGVIKQYSCPGTFEEAVEPVLGQIGMHFCREAKHCFDYEFEYAHSYDFTLNNRVAEVIAYGTVIEGNTKCCTNKLEIVREIPWYELVDLVNTGVGNTGMGNFGNENSGNWNEGYSNSGNCNDGDKNSGRGNTGSKNSGDRNYGNLNSGDCSYGNRNSGKGNNGNGNSGNYNYGNGNSGEYNNGNYNTGSGNRGYRNTGNGNSGHLNSGNWNCGHKNSGDWNRANNSNGCFNTMEPKIYMFNKPSDWTISDWNRSEAKKLLDKIPVAAVEWIDYEKMDDGERDLNPENIAGYLKEKKGSEAIMSWWNSLKRTEQEIILSLPNFDKDIFEEITGIEVNPW